MATMARAVPTAATARASTGSPVDSSRARSFSPITAAAIPPAGSAISPMPVLKR